MKSKRRNEIIKIVAEELNLPEKLVRRTYQSYWYFIKTTIANIPLKRLLTEEEFELLRTSINIPSLGKMYCTYQKYIGLTEKFNNKLKEDSDEYKED